MQYLFFFFNQCNNSISFIYLFLKQASALTIGKHFVNNESEITSHSIPGGRNGSSQI